MFTAPSLSNSNITQARSRNKHHIRCLNVTEDHVGENCSDMVFIPSLINSDTLLKSHKCHEFK